MDPITTSLVGAVFTILLYIIYQGWKINQYWKERGISYIEPTLFVGSSLPSILGKIPCGQLHEMFCKQFPNDPLFGFYDLMKPTLIVKDIDFIEKVLIKDFAHFMDRGIIQLDDKRNPLDSNLFAMSGKRWKAVRNRLTQIFTAGKLKLMYDSMKGCGDEMMRQLDKGPTEDVEMKEVLGCFAMDTIGSCAFGIDSASLSKPESEFRRITKLVFQVDIPTLIKFLILIHLPILAKFLNLTCSKPKMIKYFSSIINDSVKYRRENGFKRNDFVQLLMQMQDKGFVEIHTKDTADDNFDTTTYSTEKFELSDDQITGHAISFLTGGLDTTTMTMMLTLYELSRNPTIQVKVREEIQEVVKKAGSLTYDAVKEMNYLEQCVKETLRMYPSFQMLARKCTKQYTFPNGVTVEPGQAIVIPIIALHNDPKYFPEPKEFHPERFDPDHTIPVGAYLPFGNGPRICIGMRFAMLEIKYCIAKLLQNYTITLSPKTKQPITICAVSFVTMPKEILYFNIQKLTNL